MVIMVRNVLNSHMFYALLDNKLALLHLNRSIDLPPQMKDSANNNKTLHRFIVSSRAAVINNDASRRTIEVCEETL